MLLRISCAFLAAVAVLPLTGCLTFTPDEPRDGQDGRDGVACWDLDQDGVADTSEDTNGDGSVNVLDCRGAAGDDGADGAAGAPGTDGADGQLRIFGNGSSGARTISSDASFASAGDANDQYTDFIVDTGVTLTVPSGTVIRCTGQFINRGTIVVADGAVGGERSGVDTSSFDPSGRPAQPGVSTRVAGNGEVGTDAAARAGGLAGGGLSEFESAVTLDIGVNAGGAGGAAFAAGGGGGGGFTVIAQGEITNSGAINARGAAGAVGGGGGGGGVVILASGTRVTQAAGASISVKGGDGGASGAAEGPGGGGSGGIIHFLAPDISNGGTTDVTGGAAGALGVAGSVTAAMRSGGGGGGATAGNAGAGGAVSAGAAADPAAAEGGSAGFILQTVTDPKALF